MTDEEMRIAIAEAAGWKNCKVDTVEVYCDDTTEPGYVTTHPLRGEKYGRRDQLPDYLNDLNAIAEAEKLLTIEQRRTYHDHLMRPSRWRCYEGISATARQRAEAFLRTVGKRTQPHDLRRVSGGAKRSRRANEEE